MKILYEKKVKNILQNEEMYQSAANESKACEISKEKESNAGIGSTSSDAPSFSSEKHDTQRNVSKPKSSIPNV